MSYNWKCCSFYPNKFDASALYSGNILLCCDDFLYDTCFGNVMTDNLLDCWNNSEMEKIKLSLLDGKRISICARCNDFQDYDIY